MSSGSLDESDLYGPKGLIAMAFVAMGFFCCVEMFFLISITFRRRSGLYFWSLVGCTTAWFSVSMGVILNTWVLKGSKPGVSLVFLVSGYLVYVPSGFLILYSRLHLLQASARVLKLTLACIILEFVVVELPDAVLEILNQVHPQNESIGRVFTYWYQAESIVFMVVDVTLSGMYILHIKRMWHEPGSRNSILKKVLVLNVYTIAIDAIFIAVSYTLSSILIDSIPVSFFLF
jgi:hypothetical protein